MQPTFSGVISSKSWDVGGGGESDFLKPSENDNEDWKMNHITSQRQRYTKENWPVSLDAWIMRAYLSFDKILKRLNFREEG